jgi:HPr kinase/phosphorylase
LIKRRRYNIIISTIKHNYLRYITNTIAARRFEQEDKVRTKYTVKLKNIVEEHGLTPLHTSADYENAVIATADVNRPAMQLTGFYNYFDPHRIQIVGRVESTYLDTLTHEQRLEALERFMQYDIAALVICHGAAAFPECIEMAEKYDRNLFITSEDTSSFQANVITSLHRYLAPRQTLHGVLVEVYGEGVLLMGDSGIGKSETALELIKRGHRLVADDAVEIKKIDKFKITGTAPELIRYYMELRGIGVINVRHIFGVGAVKPEGNIDLVVKMEPWEEGKAYDRLGLTDDYEEILGMKLPLVTIPVRPGRNLAVIVELAAMNNRQKKMGYNAAETLTAAHDYAIDAGIL